MEYYCTKNSYTNCKSFSYDNFDKKNLHFSNKGPSWRAYNPDDADRVPPNVVKKGYHVISHLLTTLTKTTYHIAAAILLGIEDLHHIKVNLFCAVRDLQQGAGNLISLVHRKLGFFIAHHALYQKECYERFMIEKKLDFLSTLTDAASSDVLKFSCNLEIKSKDLKEFTRRKILPNVIHIIAIFVSHVAQMILLDLGQTILSKDVDYLKVKAFCLLRDVEELYGHLASVIAPSHGKFHVDNARCWKMIYQLHSFHKIQSQHKQLPNESNEKMNEIDLEDETDLIEDETDLNTDIKDKKTLDLNQFPTIYLVNKQAPARTLYQKLTNTSPNDHFIKIEQTFTYIESEKGKKQVINSFIDFLAENGEAKDLKLAFLLPAEDEKNSQEKIINKFYDRAIATTGITLQLEKLAVLLNAVQNGEYSIKLINKLAKAYYTEDLLKSFFEDISDNFKRTEINNLEEKVKSFEMPDSTFVQDSLIPFVQSLSEKLSSKEKFFQYFGVEVLKYALTKLGKKVYFETANLQKDCDNKIKKLFNEKVDHNIKDLIKENKSTEFVKKLFAMGNEIQLTL